MDIRPSTKDIYSLIKLNKMFIVLMYNYDVAA